MVRHSRFHVHFTPTSASWLNQVERFFAALTEKQIRRNRFRSTPQLEAAIRDSLDHHNAQPKPFVWTKSADDILNALAKYWWPTQMAHLFCPINRSSPKVAETLKIVVR
jgi:hypothetical protein